VSNWVQNQTHPESSDQPAVKPRTRLFWLLALLAVQSLYFPINRTVEGGSVLGAPIDAFIPLWPIWVVPYLLSLAWWIGCYIWFVWKMDDDLYQAFVISLIAVMLASYVVYIVFPTYVIRPSLQGDDWLTGLVAMLYENDRVNNAFPSGHTYNSVLIALYWSRWYPRRRWLWWAITATILLSTLFTRQHNLLDLIGGIAFAWLGYRLGLWWVARWRSEG
jgi:membrane-associated phospholipid phosphatase